MIVSNQNRVEYNDVTYSGDGIFLGQYGYDSIPNNNYFAYNDGSYSPHNAFEATFASGNVFTHNRANHSDYGFWLGYSFNTVVDSNEILNNQTAGIAVDRGFHNRIRFDPISGNPAGVWLWEGDPISGYTSWSSNDYAIEMIHYWPENHAIASWDLTGATSLTVWLKTANIRPFQAHSVRIGNESGRYFLYDAPASVLSNAQGVWRQYIIPLAGDATWQRSVHGSVSFTNISYVEFHADTWDAGFTLWIDGLSFDQPQDVALRYPVPRAYSLAQNYPNPFNPATLIEYTIAGSKEVKLVVYDLLGREVAVLVNERKAPGSYSVRFDANGLSSGVYFYRLQVGARTFTRRMVLLK